MASFVDSHAPLFHLSSMHWWNPQVTCLVSRRLATRSHVSVSAQHQHASRPLIRRARVNRTGSVSSLLISSFALYARCMPRYWRSVVSSSKYSSYQSHADETWFCSLSISSHKGHLTLPASQQQKNTNFFPVAEHYIPPSLKNNDNSR